VRECDTHRFTIIIIIIIIVIIIIVVIEVHPRTGHEGPQLE
jgi:preprotein translocase subunit SecG